MSAPETAAKAEQARAQTAGGAPASGGKNAEYGAAVSGAENAEHGAPTSAAKNAEHGAADGGRTANAGAAAAGGKTARALPASVAIERSIIKKYRKPIWNRFIGGCKDYRLIEAGDRIAVCVSGGKDSFLLAKCLQQLQQHSDVPFTLHFLCMDFGYRPENRALIEENAARMGVPLEIFETQIFDTVADITDSPCYVCARMRRGYLYKNAQALGCNKIALGHHFDDVIETTLMSMLWGAEVKTMMPKLHSAHYAGMELIRPLYLVREADIRAWQRYNGLRFLQCACRFTERDPAHENAGARRAAKALIAQLRRDNPQADYNLFCSTHKVNLGMVQGWQKNGEAHSFLDDYDTAPGGGTDE